MSGSDHAAVPSHSWDLTPKQAVEVQRRLAGLAEFTDRLPPLRRVGGVDVGFVDRKRVARAAVVVLSFPELELLEHAVVQQKVRFPYVPGLLSFREIPSILEALAQLKETPDVVLCDGQGRAHPRRMGIATHLGLVADLPTVGVAKSRLVGEYPPVEAPRGSRVPLMDGGEQIGVVLRTRTAVKPLFVSPGHRVGLDTAVELTLRCCTRYRLPETTRWAHRLASGPS